jgi:hypothetical protein
MQEMQSNSSDETSYLSKLPLELQKRVCRYTVSNTTLLTSITSFYQFGKSGGPRPLMTPAFVVDSGSHEWKFGMNYLESPDTLLAPEESKHNFYAYSIIVNQQTQNFSSSFMLFFEFLRE